MQFESNNIVCPLWSINILAIIADIKLCNWYFVLSTFLAVIEDINVIVSLVFEKMKREKRKVAVKKEIKQM